MYWVSLAVLALVTSAMPANVSARDKRPPPTRVYVFTARSAGGAITEDEQGRLDSVRDLGELLGHRSEFAVVPTVGEAQVRVEVVNREERDAPEGGFGGKAFTRFRETTVRLRVETSVTTGELKGMGRASWKDAAKDAVERLSKWVKSHPPEAAGTRGAGESP